MGNDKASQDAQLTWSLMFSFEGTIKTSNIRLVAMAEGTHAFPSRTRPLSPPASMVLEPKGSGRVERCQASPRQAFEESFLRKLDVGSLGNVLLSQNPSVQVPSTLEGLTVVFEMGTRGSPPPSPPNGCLRFLLFPQN